MGLIEELDALEARAKDMIAAANDAAALEAARVALLGKKGEITQVMHMMGKVAPEERPVLGKRANELRRMAESLIEHAQGDLKRQAMQELLYIPFRFENGGTRVIYYAPEEEPAL